MKGCKDCEAYKKGEGKTLLPQECWNCPVHRAERSEHAFSVLRTEYKEVYRELEKMTRERDYYRAAYHHLLREGKE